ncbi:MAG: serine--tRNA ligase [Sulfurospirillum sp.]|nr:serine--tRNA ligase [Sulfurospirillum sp.]
MLDIKLLQNNFDEISKKLKKKKVPEETLNELKEISIELKKERKKLEFLQAEQNNNSKMFKIYIKEKKNLDKHKIELLKNKEKIAELNGKVRELEEKLSKIANIVPNIPLESVPYGEDESENIELSLILAPPLFNFTPKEHWEIDNGWLDFKRGVKLAKSRFTVLKHDGAKLSRALINYMLDFNTKYGFSEVCVPFLANRETLRGTGQLPKFENDLFKIEDEDLFLIPTAEVPVTNLFQNEIIDQNELPIKITCYSECFRKEAGSAGRDTRGLIRQHQFSKVELVSIAKPEESEEIFNLMVNCASDLLTSLGLAHRKVMLCGGDLGFSAAKTVDLEVWLPGQNRYREISSISNTLDFQARRAKIRYKDGKKNRLVHTLNGSSLAIGRTIVAIMENFQCKDGTIKIPEILKDYM